VSDGAIWDLMTRSDWLMQLYVSDPSALNVRQLMWLTGTRSFQDTVEVLKDFRLDGVIENIRCPYLVTHGEYDFLGLDLAENSVKYARAKGVDVTYKMFSADETGAAHCQIDNPTLGQEYICDWIADKLGIAQK